MLLYYKTFVYATDQEIGLYEINSNEIFNFIIVNYSLDIANIAFSIISACFSPTIKKAYNKEINQPHPNTPNIIQYNIVQNPTQNQQNKEDYEISPQKENRESSPKLQVNNG